MSRKKSPKKKIYDVGGYLDLAATAAEQVGKAASWSNEVGDKEKKMTGELKDSYAAPTASSSTDELLSKMSAWNPIAQVGWRDFTNKGTFGSTFTDALTMSTEGASKGFKAGNWIGAIAGGVGGLASGIFGNIAAKRKAKKAARTYNDLAEAMNLSTQRDFENQADYLDIDAITRDLADFTGWAAYGGPLYFADGGSIHIKPSKRGTFTAAAKRHNMGVQEFASRVLANKDNYSPAMVKKANFARNAASWKHDIGGPLMTHGAEFDTGLTYIGNGGTHEENPYGGVLMGIAPDGTPNQVEEDEVIFNDYVFSKRLKVPREDRKRLKLGGPLSFADAAIKMGKESEERPNDPISRRGLEDSMMKLMMIQEPIRERQAKRQNRGRRFDWGGDIVKIDPESIDLFETIGATPIDPNSAKEAAGKISLTDAQDLGYRMGLSEKASKKKQKQERVNQLMNAARLSPLASQAGQYLSDLFGGSNRPDFNLGRGIRQANNQVRGISTRAAGQRIGYKPVDMWAPINNFNAQAAAQRSATRNLGNRVGAAGDLLALAYGQNIGLGSLLAGMENTNYDRYLKAAAHNTSIDQANRAAELQAATADAAQGNIRAQNIIAATQADDTEETMYAQTRAANRDNFFNNLGVFGKEGLDRNMVGALAQSGLFGTLNEYMQKAMASQGYSIGAANGGKLKKKKKRGLTY